MKDVTRILDAASSNDARAANELLSLVYEELRRLAAAAESMRRILVDNARRKRAERHGGGQQRVEMSDIASAVSESDDKVLLVNDALEKFALLDPQKAEVVKLRYFVGMTLDQAAEAIGISERTAKRYWAFARAWLHEEIKAQQGG